jgi:hypothetical protein
LHPDVLLRARSRVPFFFEPCRPCSLSPAGGWKATVRGSWLMAGAIKPSNSRTLKLPKAGGCARSTVGTVYRGEAAGQAHAALQLTHRTSISAGLTAIRVRYWLLRRSRQGDACPWPGRDDMACPTNQNFTGSKANWPGTVRAKSHPNKSRISSTGVCGGESGTGNELPRASKGARVPGLAVGVGMLAPYRLDRPASQG